MKVLFTSKLNPYFDSSASASRCSGIMDGLMRQGASVTLVVTCGYVGIDEFRVRGMPAHRPRLRVIHLMPTFNDNIWVRRLNRYMLPGIHKLLVRRRLRPFFKSAYDVVWLAFDNNILSAFCKYQRSLHGRSIIELNEFNDLYQTADGHISNKLQFIVADRENKVFLDAIKKIDLLAVMTRTLIRHYRPLARRDAKLFHLPMTVDLERFPNVSSGGALNKCPYIVYTGALSNRKDGVDILIRAFARIASKYPEHELHLAGFYEHDVPMQKQLITSLGLGGRIRYLNVKGRADLPSSIENASLLVLARPDSRQARGGFPTKLGEYLATGNPVCVTKVGEIPDYLEDNLSAFLSEPGSVDSFASAMDRALLDPENAKRVGANGRKVAEEHFSADVQGERLMAFLEENCKERLEAT